jgi:HK97 family phage major capsid protein
LNGADLGATANGDPNATGATGADSIGYPDLIALRKSVDPAYRASGKCGWLMNDNTLAALDSLTDKSGRPIIHPIYVNGKRVLLGYPVGICPSLPDIGSDATPVLFGALGYFVVRVVRDGGDKESGRLIRITEAPGYAENLLTGFKSFLRCNGALLAAQSGSPAASDAPVKYLQNS